MQRFENYGKQWLLSGSDNLPHLIVSWGLETYFPVRFSMDWEEWLIAIDKKPTEKEIIIDFPLANKLVSSTWSSLFVYNLFDT